MENFKAAIISLGCDKNTVDSEIMLGMLATQELGDLNSWRTWAVYPAVYVGWSYSYSRYRDRVVSPEGELIIPP